jgi:penicillin amidase
MSAFIPLMGSLFDMPATPLNGDLNMPLAQLATHGPVMRFVVAPGHEADAMFGMPGGQAGNPFTPYYGAGHDQWLRGEPLPFLKSSTHFALTLVEKASARASTR